MNKRFLMPLSSLIITNLLMIPMVYGNALEKEAGWEFTISLNTAYVSGQSNLSASDDNEIIDDLNSKADATSSVIGFPFGRVQYTTENLKTQFFLGNSRDQISTSRFQYELGLIHLFSDNSRLTAAYFPELPFLNDTWQDPFLVGAKRVMTDDNAQGGRIELSRIAGGPMTLKYAYARNKVDNDKSGESDQTLTPQELQSLQRSSEYHRIAVETMFPVYLQQTKVFLKPTLQYTARLADGDANSYNDVDFQLGLLIFSGRHTSITTLNIGTSAYQEKNPIFNKKQDTLNAGIFSIYSYAEAFNWKPLSFTLIAGYSQKDSEITFYDQKGFIFSTGLAYTF